MKNEIIIERLEEIVDGIPNKMDYVYDNIRRRGNLGSSGREVFEKELIREYKKDVQEKYKRQLRNLRKTFGRGSFNEYLKEEFKEFNEKLLTPQMTNLEGDYPLLTYKNTNFLGKFDKIFNLFDMRRKIKEGESIKILDNLTTYYHKTDQLVRRVKWHEGFTIHCSYVLTSDVDDIGEFFDNLKNFSMGIDFTKRDKILDKIFQETTEVFLHNKNYDPSRYATGRSHKKAEILEDNIIQIKKKFPNYSIHTKQNCDFFNKTLLKNISSSQYQRGESLLDFFKWGLKYEELEKNQKEISIDKDLRVLYG